MEYLTWVSDMNILGTSSILLIPEVLLISLEIVRITSTVFYHGRLIRVACSLVRSCLILLGISCVLSRMFATFITCVLHRHVQIMLSCLIGEHIILLDLLSIDIALQMLTLKLSSFLFALVEGLVLVKFLVSADVFHFRDYFSSNITYYIYS